LEVCNIRDARVVLLQTCHGSIAYLALLTIDNASGDTQHQHTLRHTLTLGHDTCCSLGST
jgi:hypothetical protein